jgi:hypothetical protein
VVDAARFDHMKRTGEVEKVVENGFGFIVEQDGKPLFGYTMEVQGTNLFITSASGRASFDIVDVGLKIVEAQADGLESVGFVTKRRGLVKKAQKNGYEIVSYELRKKLK